MALAGRLVLAVALGGSFAATPCLGMPQAQVRVGGQAFRVDVADTPELQAKGLSGRQVLGPHEGMLFLFARRDRLTFWMRGMVIPIDIIWIANERIVHIEHNVPPPTPGTPLGELPTYASEEPANAVLEVAAGRMRALGVREGDRVHLEL